MSEERKERWLINQIDAFDNLAREISVRVQGMCPGIETASDAKARCLRDIKRMRVYLNTFEEHMRGVK